MKLEAYRKRNKLTYREIGTAIGVSVVTARNICLGKHEILLKHAAEVVLLTGGEVSFKDLLEQKVKKEEAPVC